MDDLTMWSLLVGFLSPLLISVVQQPKWTQQTRAFVTFVSSLILGAGTAYFQGDLDDAQSTVSAILIVLVSGMTTYRNLWKTTGIAPKIEAKTSRAQGARVVDAPVQEPTAVTSDGEAGGEQVAPRKAPRKRASSDKGEGLIGVLGAVLFIVGAIFLILGVSQKDAISVPGLVLLVVGGACMYADGGVPGRRR